MASFIPSFLNYQSDTTSLKELIPIVPNTLKEEKLYGLFSYDTVFTVVVTLVIFIFGILIERSIKYLNEKSKRKKYFKYYLDEITDKSAPKLINAYKDFYQTKGIDEGIPSTSPKLLTGDFQRIRNIADMELFYAFKDKKSLSSMLSVLDFFELMLIEVESFHKLVRKETDTIRDKLQILLSEYFKTIAHYVEHVRVDNPQYEHRDAFRNLVNESIIKYHSDLKIQKSLIEVHKIIRKIQIAVVTTNIFRTDQEGAKIADMGREITIYINKLRHATIECRLEYRSFYNSIKKCKEKLEENRNKVKWN